MNPQELNNSDLDRSKNHISNLSNNFLNLSQNRVSSLSISYIAYFYHVFPLHLNSFNRLFSDVISPKLDNLKLCISDFTACYDFIYNLRNQLQYIINYYNLRQIYFHSTESFNSFIYNLDVGKLIEPYVEILIDAIDHDIDVLTDLISYLNVFNYYYKVMKSIRLSLPDVNSVFEAINHISYIPSYVHFLSSIYTSRSSISSFVNLFNNFKSNIENNMRKIKIYIGLLTIFKKKISEIKSTLGSIGTTHDYCSVENKLTEALENKVNGLNNIYSLDYLFKNVKITKILTALNKPINKLRLRLTRLELIFNQSLELINMFQSLLLNNIIDSNIIKYAPKQNNGEYKIIFSIMEDEQIKYNEQLLQYSDEIHKYVLQSYRNVKSLIISIERFLSSIKDSSQKLSNAKSKLDKREYIKHLLKILNSGDIESLESIDEMINKIEDKSKINNYVGKTIINSTIIYFIFHTLDQINDKQQINFIIQKIRQTLSIFDKLRQIDTCVKQLMLITCKLTENNIYIYTKEISSLLKRIQSVFNEIDFSMIQQIEKKIILMEQIKKKIDSYNNIKQFKETKTLKIKEILNYIITILTSIKSLNEKLKCFRQKLVDQLKCCEHKINDLECAIEGVARNMVGCSLKSLSNHLTNSTNSNLSGMNSHMSYKEIYVLYSQICVIEYNVVVNSLFQILEKTNRIFNILNKVEYCDCVNNYNTSNKSEIRLTHGFKFNHDDSHSKFHMKPVISDDGNHMCLCIVTNYLLYPKLVTGICYLMDSDFDLLSTLSRKYDKYRFSIGFDLIISKFFMFCLEIFHNLSMFMEYRYLWATSNVEIIEGLYCFCRGAKDKYYPYFISIILYLSSLIENIWAMGDHAIPTAIQSLSSLLSEYQSIHVYTNYGSGTISSGSLSESETSKSSNSAQITLSQMINMTSRIDIKNNFSSSVGQGSGGSSSGTSNDTLSIVLHSPIIKSQTILVKNGAKLFFKTVISGLAILIKTPLFTLAYSKISGLVFYLLTNGGKIGLASINPRIGLMRISFEYLNSTGQQSEQEGQNTCTRGSNGCKLCFIVKLIYLSLYITLNIIRYILGTFIKKVIVDDLKKTSEIKIHFVFNSFINVNIVALTMVKNINLAHQENSYHKNIANIFPCLTMG